MRLEDFLNQTAGTSNRNRQYKAASQHPAPASIPGRGQDTVSISPAAKLAATSAGARDAEGNLQDAKSNLAEPAASQATAETDERPVFAEFKIFMDKLLGRNQIGTGKSPAEQMKELAEKIKKLKMRLSEVMANPKFSDSAKGGQAKAISAQIEGLEAAMAELGKQIGSDAA